MSGVLQSDGQQMVVAGKAGDVEELGDLGHHPEPLVSLVGDRLIHLHDLVLDRAIDDLKALARVRDVPAPAEPEVEVHGPAHFLDRQLQNAIDVDAGDDLRWPGIRRQ